MLIYKEEFIGIKFEIIRIKNIYTIHIKYGHSITEHVITSGLLKACFGWNMELKDIENYMSEFILNYKNLLWDL